MGQKQSSMPAAGTQIVQAALQGKRDTVVALLDGGLAVDATDAAGNHALGAACCGGHHALVATLITRGAPRRSK